MKNPMIIMAAVVALLVGAGGGFFAGMAYQQNKTPAVTQQGNFAGRGNRAAGQGAGIRPVSGQVLSVGNGMVTIKLADGSSDRSDSR